MNKDFVYKRRLLALADLLQKLPPKRFDYSHWVGDNWKGSADLSCGTTACAFGWATTMPSLRRLGLMLKSDSRCDIGGEVRLNRNGKFLTTEKAALEVFGLSYGEFEYLFVPYSGRELTTYKLSESYLGDHATAKEVAAHIRKFVNAKYNRAVAR
jgi:hypothetical protein